jgi:hypothetical protein
MQLSPGSRSVLWVLYGALFWGGSMALVFFWVKHFMGHDPWSNFNFTVAACLLLGAWWGLGSGRRIEATFTSASER